jgi:predicted  nucleic acid-binding Zn-ribbon protein
MLQDLGNQCAEAEKEKEKTVRLMLGIEYEQRKLGVRVDNLKLQGKSGSDEMRVIEGEQKKLGGELDVLKRALRDQTDVLQQLKDHLARARAG